MVTSCQRVIKHPKSPRHNCRKEVAINGHGKRGNGFDAVWRAVTCRAQVSDSGYCWRARPEVSVPQGRYDQSILPADKSMANGIPAKDRFVISLEVRDRDTHETTSRGRSSAPTTVDVESSFSFSDRKLSTAHLRYPFKFYRVSSHGCWAKQVLRKEAHLLRDDARR